MFSEIGDWFDSSGVEGVDVRAQGELIFFEVLDQVIQVVSGFSVVPIRDLQIKGVEQTVQFDPDLCQLVILGIVAP